MTGHKPLDVLMGSEVVNKPKHQKAIGWEKKTFFIIYGGNWVTKDGGPRSQFCAYFTLLAASHQHQRKKITDHERVFLTNFLFKVLVISSNSKEFSFSKTSRPR
jgi:hypothetical protein